ncbi:MAG: rRNA maturation RNase YbeY, partial [Acidobacteriota bacterium]
MSDPASLLVFEYAPSRLRRTSLKLHAVRLAKEVSGGREFTCLITNDNRLRMLNRTWRGKDEPTDVLSFPAAPMPLAKEAVTPPLPLGELAISCERARLQAAEHGHSLEEEICILMLHGLLHLMGMDH